MRRDEARLSAANGDTSPAPSLVWFTWDRPTITLGRLQDERALDQRACARDGIPLVRRPTGGRAVLHADEWTYGAVVPLAHPRLGGSLDASCRALVGIVCEALSEAYGIVFDAAADEGLAKAGPSGACFTQAFGYEAVVGGRKLMGSAQRRAGRALLQQGSLLVGPGHERLGRYLSPGTASAEAALARGAITLYEILGAQPEPTPFRAALRRAWAKRVEPAARSA